MNDDSWFGPEEGRWINPDGSRGFYTIMDDIRYDDLENMPVFIGKFQNGYSNKVMRRIKRQKQRAKLMGNRFGWLGCGPARFNTPPYGVRLPTPWKKDR
jgi:hypothetical protein